ncbi:MAG: cobyrinate a,c-diamide synthase [Lachnospiraceae bacterium]|nr:cobyrinate a,c-diamide synthase [Lachnospiraceae bacterium]
MIRIMIASPSSGSGKTSITIALLNVLKKRGLNIVSFKTGPDYIDPLFHKNVLGVKSHNLDTFFTSKGKTLELFNEASDGADIAVMEGVMGLYDGVGGVLMEGSTYDLAAVTETPVILVVNAKGMGKSVIALIKGFLSMDDKKLIKGVILNRTSKSFYSIIKEEIEKELGIRVLGFMPDKKEVSLSNRHLGLVTPGEIEDINEIIDILSKDLEENVDVDAVLKVAGEAPDETLGGASGLMAVEAPGEALGVATGVASVETFGENVVSTTKPVIAISKDEAFCFLYEENVNELKKAGAEIKYFSPLHDKSLPNDADAVILVGGYPEEYLKILSDNESMMMSVKEAADKGMPVVAECGGFMYLHKIIKDKDGIEYKGVGIIDGECYYTGHLVRFGYVDIKEKKFNFLESNGMIKGHEFHYFDSTYNGDDCIITKVYSKKSYDAVIDKDNMWAGFPHLYYPSGGDWTMGLVKKAVKYHEEKN